METSVNAPPPSSRRSFLARAGGIGAAVAIGSAVLPVRTLTAAFAQEEELEDADLAAFAQSVGLAAVAAYADAGNRVGDAAAAAMFGQFSAHHKAHADAMGAAAGAKATNAPNPTILRAIQDQLGTTKGKEDVLRIALDIENAGASTHLFLVSELDDPALISLAASILPVASQQAVAVGQMLGLPLKQLLPPSPDTSKLGEANAFETKDRALQPSTHPLPQG